MWIQSLKSLYYSFIRSFLEHSSVLWSPTYGVHIDKIESMQKIFSKYVICNIECTNNLPNNGARCMLIDLISLESRRRNFNTMLRRDILVSKRSCSEILKFMRLYALERIQRGRQLYIPFHIVNYGQYELVTRAGCDFNSVYVHCRKKHCDEGCNRTS